MNQVVILRRNDGTEGLLLTDLNELPPLEECECSAGPGCSYRLGGPPRVPQRARLNTGPAIGLALCLATAAVFCGAVWAIFG